MTVEALTVDGVRTLANRIRGEVGKAITGQESTVDLLLIALFARGHILLEGPPGTAKTFLARCFARATGLDYGRIQFTPDLMPGDIVGANLFNFQTSTFTLTRGPIFTELLLADEINRTPPKTQAALLEAMQEKQVTVAGNRHPLPNPFFVLATQNPIEQEGTYPLPEAQQDRFTFTIKVDYPSEEDEFRIIETTTSAARPHVDRVISGEELLMMQSLVRKVPAADYVIKFALKLARLSRPHGQDGEPPSADVPDFIRKYVNWGAGPRAGQNLILAAKARALLRGRTYVAIEDVRAVALPVLRHRIITNYNAGADNVTPDEIVRKLLALVPRDDREK